MYSTLHTYLYIYIYIYITYLFFSYCVLQILHRDDYRDERSLVQFWRTLCRDVGTEIDNILTSSSSSSSSSSSIEMLPSDDITELKLKLAEAQDDLLRDEDIFAEKLSEIKRHKRQMKEYEVEISALKAEIDVMKSTVNANEDINDYSITVEPMTSPNRQDRTLPKSPSRGVSLKVAIDSREDLELSHMIDLHEPDMSQLIEDLETVNQEKEVRVLYDGSYHIQE